MRSWTDTAFFFKIFFLPKKKSKRCERKPPMISNLKSKIQAHRPSIKGTKALIIIIKEIIIITHDIITICTSQTQRVT